MKKVKIIILITLLVALLLLAGFLKYVVDSYKQNGAFMSGKTLEDSFNDLKDRVETPDINLISKSVITNNGTELEFMIPEIFEMEIVAEDLGKARFMAFSPDNRLFVPDIVDYSLSRQGKVLILDDFNEEEKHFETKHTYLSGLRGPNSVAFYTDENGEHWLYLALTANIVRYKYNFGDTSPSSPPEVIFNFPNTQAPEAKSVVWHITRTIKFHGDRLYMSIGSGCNSCEQPKGDTRATIASIKPDGSDLKIYADGLRNSVDFTFDGDQIYATENGVDHLGPNAPSEVMYKIVEGENYGWPYCYELDGEVIEDVYTSWKEPINCEETPRSLAYFEPRSAPLGIEYFENTHPILDDTFLVALHGSFDPNTKHGYQIIRVTKDGERQVFMDGFQDENGERYGRPVDFLRVDNNSFFFTDDFGGRIYYLYIK